MLACKVANEKQERALAFTFELAPAAAAVFRAFVPALLKSLAQTRSARSKAAPEAVMSLARSEKKGTGFAMRVRFRGDRAWEQTQTERQEVLAAMIDAVTKPKTRVKTKTERPRLHKVILLNDDYTPREFVVSVLKAEFRMTEDQAHKVMITAHRLGVCVVAVFTRDVAETKATRATDAGRAKGYPLLFTTEPEE